MLIKIILLVVFFAITIGIGIYCRKRINNVGDFVLGGRGIGPWMTAFAYGTSYFSAVVFIGYAGQFGWQFGISATWIGIGNALIGSLLAWVVLGRRTRIMTKHFEAATMPEFFERRYNSRPMKIVSSVIIFVFLVPYTSSIYKGLSGLFAMAFGIDFTVCIIIMAVVTGLYVILGGYLATAINDLVQGIIMLVGIVAVVVAILNLNGGLMESIAALSQIPSPEQPEMQGAYASFLGPNPFSLLSVVILTSLGTWGLPQMVHKFYTIKSEKSIKTGTIVSTVFALVISCGSYFMGGFGRLFVEGDTPANGYDSVVPAMLENLPDVLIGVVVILVLSASMSTLSSLVLTSSSTFTIDFVKGYIKKDLSGKGQMLLIRILCAVFIAISVVIALNPNNLISSLMSISWGALAGAFLGPFLYGLFWKGVTRAGVWAGFISGIAITGFGMITTNFSITLPGVLQMVNTPLSMGAIAIVFSLIIVPVVSLLTPKLPAKHLEEAFSCYNEKVVTVKKLTLNGGDEEQKAEQ